MPSGPTPMKEAICGGTGSGWRASQAARECRAQDQRACQGDLTAAARVILVLDWWVLGGAAELDAFGAMVEGFAVLTDEMRRDILVRGGSCIGHTYYGLQLRRMNATLRFVGNVAQSTSRSEGCGNARTATPLTRVRRARALRPRRRAAAGGRGRSGRFPRRR